RSKATKKPKAKDSMKAVSGNSSADGSVVSTGGDESAEAVSIAALAESNWFVPDDEETNPGRNSRLAALLAGPWHGLAIVQIDRIEIGPRSGWLATYRS